MTTLEPDEQGKTAPIELPVPELAPTPAPPAVEPTPPPAAEPIVESPPHLVARAASATQQEVMFVPLAVSIGDGFKFGCGFFLAGVLGMLVGFVLLGVLFVLTGLFGLNLPLAR